MLIDESNTTNFTERLKKYLLSIVMFKYFDSAILILGFGFTVFYSLYENRIESIKKLLTGNNEILITRIDVFNIVTIVAIVFLILQIISWRTQFKRSYEQQKLVFENEKQLTVAREYYIKSLSHDFSRICNDALKQSVKQLVSLYSFIHSATVYKYNVKTIGAYIQINLKPVRTHCIVNTRTSIIFENYYIDKTFFNRFMELRHRCSMYTKMTIPEDLSNELLILLYDLNEVMLDSRFDSSDEDDIIESEELTISINQINDYHCGCFALVNAIKALLEGIYEVETVYDNFESVLRSRMRTGILTSILLENEYYHIHQGQSSKKGRIYMWQPFLFNNFDCILSLNVNVDDLQNDFTKLFTNDEIRQSCISSKESIPWNLLRKRILETAKSTFDEVLDKIMGINLQNN